jgi:hypothetical protein
MGNIIPKNEYEHIVDLCKYYQIHEYIIMPDGRLDVTSGFVDMSDFLFTELPLQFYRINGNFNAQRSKLTTLKGCPEIVTGDFNINQSVGITSLEYGPRDVGTINCDDCNITSLQYSPTKIKYQMRCYGNLLKDLMYLADVNELYCGGSSSFVTFQGMGKADIIYCSRASIETVQGLPDNLLSLRIHDCDQLVSLFGLPRIINSLTITACEHLENTKVDYSVELSTSRIKGNGLPSEFGDFTEYQLLFKYQHYYDIWNADGSFNKFGFADFLAEIAEGLQ